MNEVNVALYRPSPPGLCGSGGRNEREGENEREQRGQAKESIGSACPSPCAVSQDLSSQVSLTVWEQSRLGESKDAGDT